MKKLSPNENTAAPHVEESLNIKNNKNVHRFRLQNIPYMIWEKTMELLRKFTDESVKLSMIVND